MNEPSVPPPFEINLDRILNDPFLVIFIFGLIACWWAYDEYRKKKAQEITPGPLPLISTDVSTDAPPEIAPPVPVVPPATLPMDIHRLSKGTAILVVGTRGSGKSTLIKALVGLKEMRTIIFDPHSSPDKWPAGSRIIGGGSNYEEVYSGIKELDEIRKTRSGQLNRGEVKEGEFDNLVVASDEYGSIVSAAAKYAEKGEETPGEMNILYLKEGRKFNLHWIGGAHGDTTRSLGSKGDHEAFLQSFDYIVYTGVFVRTKLESLDKGYLMPKIPMGVNKQGILFPLKVLVFSPTSGNWFFLDMRGIDTIPALPRPADLLEEDEPLTFMYTEAMAEASKGRGSMLTDEQVIQYMIYRMKTNRKATRSAVAVELWGYSGGAALGISERLWEEALKRIEMVQVA
jgi:energy-coupling factor transporter ATP-binding protein EcfA2